MEGLTNLGEKLDLVLVAPPSGGHLLAPNAPAEGGATNCCDRHRKKEDCAGAKPTPRRASQAPNHPPRGCHPHQCGSIRSSSRRESDCYLRRARPVVPE